MGSDCAGRRGHSGKAPCQVKIHVGARVSLSPAEKGAGQGKGKAMMRSSPRPGQGSRRGKGLFPSPEESQGEDEGKGKQGKGIAMTNRTIFCTYGDFNMPWPHRSGRTSQCKL